jgi:hypothetical protein
VSATPNGTEIIALRQKAEGRRQKAGGRRQKAGGRRQKAEGRRQEAGVRCTSLVARNAIESFR